MIFGLLLVCLGGCALWDVRTGRIPNLWLAFWLCVIGIGKVFCGGESGGQKAEVFLAYFGAMFFAAAILFPLFIFRMMGAGDIKLMAVLCGALGIQDGFPAIFYGLAAAAAWSFLYMVRMRILKKRILYFLNFIRRLLWAEYEGPYYLAERDGKEASFCLAPFLLGGFVLWLAEKGGV